LCDRLVREEATSDVASLCTPAFVNAALARVRLRPTCALLSRLARAERAFAAYCVAHCDALLQATSDVEQRRVLLRCIALLPLTADVVRLLARRFLVDASCVASQLSALDLLRHALQRGISIDDASAWQTADRALASVAVCARGAVSPTLLERAAAVRALLPRAASTAAAAAAAAAATDGDHDVVSAVVVKTSDAEATADESDDENDVLIVSNDDDDGDDNDDARADVDAIADDDDDVETECSASSVTPSSGSGSSTTTASSPATSESGWLRSAAARPSRRRVAALVAHSAHLQARTVRVVCADGCWTQRLHAALLLRWQPDDVLRVDVATLVHVVDRLVALHRDTQTTAATSPAARAAAPASRDVVELAAARRRVSALLDAHVRAALAAIAGVRTSDAEPLDAPTTCALLDTLSADVGLLNTRARRARALALALSSFAAHARLDVWQPLLVAAALSVRIV
jgi:hypothetical protein